MTRNETGRPWRWVGGDGGLGPRVDLAAVEQAGERIAGRLLHESVPDRLGAQRGADPSGQLGLGERLDDVVDRTGVEPGHAGRGLGVGREEDHGRRYRTQLLHGTAHGVPVTAGHRHVDEQQVGQLRDREVDCFVAVARGDHVVARAPQPRTDHRPRDAVVVGEQHKWKSARRRHDLTIGGSGGRLDLPHPSDRRHPSHE